MSTQESNVKKRIQELENLLDDNCNISHAELVELYVLRDMDMSLDPKKEIEWGLHKLCCGDKSKLRKELLELHDCSDNFTFYNTCTLEELFILGY